MKKLILLIGMTLILITCSETPPNQMPSTSTKEISKPKINEDELLTRLSMDFIATPSGQAEKDNNQIITFAIDNLLNLSRTQSGLFYIIKKEGYGELAKWGDKVNIHYKGTLMDNTVFDSSYKRNQPLNIYIGNMVQGLNEGLQLIKPGGEATFYLPSTLGYGKDGLKNSKGVTIVPEDAILVFDVTLISQ